MKRHGAPWAIAAVAVALVLAASALRQGRDGGRGDPTARAADRDRLVAEMLARLDGDPRVRSAATQRVVEAVSRYCADPALATAETWYGEGLRAYYADSDLAAAQAAFERSTALRPEWAWPVNGLAVVRFTQGQRAEAERLFARAEALEPTWSRPQSDRAILYRRAGDVGVAFDHARRALAIEPEHPVNHFNYGVMLDELGRHVEARAEYERVLRDAPDMPQAAYNLACGYAREGDATAAAPYLARAIAGDAAFGEYAKEDPDFDRIRKSPAFEAALSGVKP